jgi:hypothetical protein
MPPDKTKGAAVFRAAARRHRQHAAVTCRISARTIPCAPGAPRGPAAVVDDQLDVSLAGKLFAGEAELRLQAGRRLADGALGPGPTCPEEDRLAGLVQLVFFRGRATGSSERTQAASWATTQRSRRP